MTLRAEILLRAIGHKQPLGIQHSRIRAVAIDPYAGHGCGGYRDGDDRGKRGFNEAEAALRASGADSDAHDRLRRWP